MPKQSLSNEAREGIIRLYVDGTKPIQDIAQLYGANVSTVRSFLARYRNTGKVAATPRGGLRHSRIEQHHLNWLAQTLDEFCNRTIDALRHGLVEEYPQDFGLHPPSSTTIWRAVNNTLKYRLKVLHVEPKDYNLPRRIDKRMEWCKEVQRAGVDLRNCVFLDESGFNLHVSNTYGCAAIGSRPITIRPSARGSNISLVMAMNAYGVIAYDLLQGGFNGERFKLFLETKLFPRLKKPEIIIMDNASIHKTPEVKATIQASQHTQLLLPPYSPFLNASEWVFGFLKPRCARKNFQGPDSLEDMVRSALWTVDSNQCRGWTEAVNSNFVKALRKEPLGRQYLLAHLPVGDGTNNDDNDDDDEDKDSNDWNRLRRANSQALAFNEVDNGLYQSEEGTVYRAASFDDPPAP